MASHDIHSLRTKRYSGKKTSIVIGIDVGTVVSSVSYAILRPNEVPQIHSVEDFSEQAVRDSEVPSVIFYDLNNYASPRAMGDATKRDEVIDEAVKRGWFECEHFILHLCPRGQKLETNGLGIGELPRGKIAEEAMGDFLHYLVDETGKFICRHHVDRQGLWQQVEDEAIYVLRHPSAWSTYSQQRYRTSAILGGLVPDTADGRGRIKFVTEGEASALACIVGGLGPVIIKGFRFIITEIGRHTANTTVFEVGRIFPLQLEEVVPTDRRLAGSLLVSMRGKDLLRTKLANSIYDNGETLDQLITDKFEASAIKQFTGETGGFLKVASGRENNAKLGIKYGFLQLSREDLAACFDDCISEIVDSIRDQPTKCRADEKIPPVWLVGEFGSYPYFPRKLQKTLGTVVQPLNMSPSNAVANGAVLHYLNEMEGSFSTP